MAAGYEIPISISNAQSFSAPQSLTAPVVFNFGGGSVGLDTSNEQSPINPVTASSAAALGNADSKAEVAASGKGSTLGIDTTKLVLILAVAVIGTYFAVKHHK